MGTMDLTTGPGLASSIASFINREDLAGNIPAFVRLAEARFNTDLRMRQMVARVETDTDGRFFDLPTDFIEAKSIRITAPCQYAGSVDYGDPDELSDRLSRRSAPDQTNYPQHGGRRPRFGASPLRYGIEGNALYLAPVPDVTVTVELTYYKAIPALDLVTVGASNWLLLRAPHLYLYGALIASAPFLVEDERLPTWTGLATDAITSLNAESERAAVSGSRLNARRRTFG